MAHLECARRGAGRRCAHGGKPAPMRSGERGRWQDGVADRPVGGMRRRPAPGYRRLPCAIAFRPTSSSIFQFTDRLARERPTVYFKAFALIYAPCKSISTHTATHAVIHAAARDAAGLADTGSGLNETGIRAAGTIPSASSHRRSNRQSDRPRPARRSRRIPAAGCPPHRRRPRPLRPGPFRLRPMPVPATRRRLIAAAGTPRDRGFSSDFPCRRSARRSRAIASSPSTTDEVGPNKSTDIAVS